MVVDRSKAERPEPKIYEFLVRNRGKAYTKQELKEECEVETLGSMYSYTSMKPYVWKRVYFDGSVHYTLSVNWFALGLLGACGVVVVFLAWMLVTNPSAFYTCGL